MPGAPGPATQDGSGPQGRRRRGWSIPLLAVVVAIVAWAGGLIGLAGQMLGLRGLGPDDFGGSLELSAYRVTMEAQVIEGLTDNTSGLTYSAATGTLFAAINNPPKLAELSTDGTLLRRIPLTGAHDVEGITHVEGETFIIVDEGNSRLNWITITPETTSIDLAGTPSLTFDLDKLSNHGFEGISWDQRKLELVLVQEMKPVRVFVVDGLEQPRLDGAQDGTLREWQPDHWAEHGLSDLSSVSVHDPTGNMLLLSHMASLLVEFDPNGAARSTLALRAGQHGLKATVPQAEGVAVGPAGEVFIVSEPNLFYRFEPGIR